jgi:hypothetical protein
VTPHGWLLEDTGLFFECQDLNATHKELLGKGVQVREPVVTNDGMKQMYFATQMVRMCFQRST